MKKMVYFRPPDDQSTYFALRGAWAASENTASRSWVPGCSTNNEASVSPSRSAQQPPPYHPNFFEISRKVPLVFGFRWFLQFLLDFAPTRLHEVPSPHFRKAFVDESMNPLSFRSLRWARRGHAARGSGKARSGIAEGRLTRPATFCQRSLHTCQLPARQIHQARAVLADWQRTAPNTTRALGEAEDGEPRSTWRLRISITRLPRITRKLSSRLHEMPRHTVTKLITVTLPPGDNRSAPRSSCGGWYRILRSHRVFS